MPKYTRSEAKEYAKEKLRGIFTAPMMPDTPDGQIDEAGLRRDVRYYIDVIKVGGLYIHGFYGCFWLLTLPERKRAIEIVVDEAKGAVPIICRCAHQTPRDAIDLAKHAESVGADFISMIGPWLGRGSEQMVIDYFEMVAAAINIGISVFNTPQAGYIIRPELMARLGTIQNVAALKNGVSLAHTIQVRELAGDSIVVIDPDEDDFLINMTQFGQKAIYTGTNMMYDSAKATPMKDYVDAGLRGDHRACAELFYKLTPIRDVHRKWVRNPWKASGVCPVARIKFWTQQLGMTGGLARPPLPQISEEERQGMLADLAAVGLIDSKKPIGARA